MDLKTILVARVVLPMFDRIPSRLSSDQATET
jgi:hypothetical protein